MKRSTFLRRKRRGANAIEFAMTLPIFVFVTFAMMEYGWYFSRIALVQGGLSAACREGSIVDAADPPPFSSFATAVSCPGGEGDQCIINMVEEELDQRINQSANLTCTNCSAVVGGTVPNRFVRCIAEVEYESITGLTDVSGLKLVMPDQVSFESQVRLEWQRQSL